MEQYYIATAEGKTEGPYSFEELEAFYTHGKIRIDTLVCVAGGQEWAEFKTILSQKGKELTELHSKKNIAGSFLNERKEKKAWLKIQELNKDLDEMDKQKNDADFFLESFVDVEGMFKVVGILALFVGFILALCHTGAEYGTIGFIYMVSGVFSCLGCFWCAKVITLLSRAVNLLSALVSKFDSFSDKQ